MRLQTLARSETARRDDPSPTQLPTQHRTAKPAQEAPMSRRNRQTLTAARLLYPLIALLAILGAAPSYASADELADASEEDGATMTIQLSDDGAASELDMGAGAEAESGGAAPDAFVLRGVSCSVIAFHGDVDDFGFTAQAGDYVTVEMQRTSGNVDPYLKLYRNGALLGQDDNSGPGSDARVEMVYLPNGGTHIIRASSANPWGTGHYCVTVSLYRGFPPPGGQPSPTAVPPQLPPRLPIANATVLDVWTTNWLGLPDVYFGLNEQVKIRTKVRNSGLIAANIQLRYEKRHHLLPGLWTPFASQNVVLPPGESSFTFSTTPAVFGYGTFRVKVTYNGQTTSDSAQILPQ